MRLENAKWRTLSETVLWRESLRQAGQRVVLTNGCFDMLHPGHLFFLQEARALGDALMVAINSDASVKALKGPHRPIFSVEERAYALAALHCVDAIVSFETPRLDAEIRSLKPDLYAKAGDYTLETLDMGERAALDAVGAAIRFRPFLEGFSTTSLIKKIQRAGSL